MKRAFIYTRVSTLEQANGYSISEQEQRLKSYAEAKGYKVIKVYSDVGVSGGTLNRPQLNEMVKDINSTDTVLVYKLDRLSRSQKDTLYLIEEVFIKNNVDFISLNESFDTSTSFGRAMIGILSVFAQLEREQIKERFAMGKVGRAKSGKWHGGGKWRPYGYDYVDDKLVINEYESTVVRELYHLASQGYGVGRSFRLINEKFPDSIATSSTIHRILKNPIYIGKLQWDGESYDGNHPHIITESLYQDVQDIKTLNSSKYSKHKTSAYMLSGKLTCGECGSNMNGRTGGKRKDGTQLLYYVCAGRGDKPWIKNHPNCKSESKRKDEIENIVLNEMKKINLSDVEVKREDHSDELKVLESELSSVDKQLDKLLDLYLLDNIDLTKLDSRQKKLNNKKNKLMKNIERINEDGKQDEFKQQSINSFSDVDVESLDIDKLRLLVNLLAEKVVIKNGDVSIYWRV